MQTPMNTCRHVHSTTDTSVGIPDLVHSVRPCCTYDNKVCERKPGSSLLLSLDDQNYSGLSTILPTEKLQVNSMKLDSILQQQHLS